MSKRRILIAFLAVTLATPLGFVDAASAAKKRLRMTRHGSYAKPNSTSPALLGQVSRRMSVIPAARAVCKSTATRSSQNN